MPKRFNDTDIWKKQRWFRKLIPEYKLAFLYIIDQCDHAGIWNIDCSDLLDDLGIKTFDLSEFIDAINKEYDKISGIEKVKERLYLLKNNKLWITGFVQFQYEGKDKMIKANNNMVKGALFILDSIKFDPIQPITTLANPCQPLPTPTNPCEETTLLAQGLGIFIRISENIDVLRQGLATLKEKDRDKYCISSLTKKSKDGKTETEFSGNFKARGEEVLAKIYYADLAEAERRRKENI